MSPPSALDPAGAKHQAKRRAIRRANRAVQMIGALVLFNEAVVRSWSGVGEARSQVLFVCAIALLGVEGAKDLLITFLDGTLGRTDAREPAERDE